MNTTTERAAPLAVVPQEPGADLPAVYGPATGTAAMVLQGDSLDRMLRMADVMATAAVTVPQHFRGKPGDCLAVIMQATQWGMNPFAVSQKTHVVNGTLGYEAQLVNAVIQQSGAIKGRFHYEFSGDGACVQCRVGAIPRGETEVVWTEWLSAAHVTTKNSPLWKTNPKQQLGYLQVKNWGRLYAPGSILGVYSDDELEDVPPERDITPEGETIKPATAKEALKAAATGKESRKPVVTLGQVTNAIASANTLDELRKVRDLANSLTSHADIDAAANAYNARGAQLKAAIAAAPPAGAPDSETGEISHGDGGGDPEPGGASDFAKLLRLIQGAGDMDALDAHADLIQYVPTMPERERLAAAYKARREELRG